APVRLPFAPARTVGGPEIPIARCVDCDLEARRQARRCTRRRRVSCRKCQWRSSRMPLDAGRIVKPAAKLRQLLRKARRRPLPDEIHDLRTNALRFEASIEALRSDASRSERRPLRDLAKVRSRAGKIRDMDVLTANAATLHADGEQDCVVRLLEGLGAERDKQARKLKTSLDKRVP